MLDFMRKYTKGWVAFFILAIVGLPFLFFGINDYFNARVANYVAKVGDTEISDFEYQEQRQRYLSQLRSQFGEQFNAAQFENLEFKRNFVDQMVDKELILQQAKRIGLTISDARVREEIEKIDAFKIDGKFDGETYKNLLKQQGMSPEMFQVRVRDDLLSRLLPMQVAQSGLVTDAMVDRQIALRDQKRDLRHLVMPSEPMTAVKMPSDAEIKTYYDSHQDEFKTQEMVALDYVELNATTLAAPVPAEESVLRQTYEKDLARFGTLEARLTSHILIKPTGPDAAAQKAASEKASKLAAEARGGKAFADLAKAHSEDIGAKESGGDLGWLETGVTREAFNKKLFAMKAGEISDPVLTEDGYHVIQLREVRPAAVRPFEEVRAELETEYLNNEKLRVYSEQATAMINAATADQTSLAEAAKAGNTVVQRSPLFSRIGGGGIAMYPQAITAGFSDEVLASGANSEALEVGENHILIVRLAEHKPVEVQKLEIVKSSVIARLQGKALEELNEKKANELLKKLQAGTSIDALIPGTLSATATGVARTGSAVDPTVVTESFKLPRPAAGKTSTGKVRLPQGGYALIELTAVQDGDAKAAADRDSVREQLVQQIGRDESQALIEALRKSTEIKVVEDKL